MLASPWTFRYLDTNPVPPPTIPIPWEHRYIKLRLVSEKMKEKEKIIKRKKLDRNIQSCAGNKSTCKKSGDEEALLPKLR